VTFEVKSVGTGNALQLRVVDPPSLVESNKHGPTMEKQVKDAFKKIIQPQFLFKYLNNFDLNGNEYEMALNPIRYRHIIII